MKTPFIVWITGLPASGKSTITKSLINALRDLNISVVHLESDKMRTILTPNATYSQKERDFFYRVISDLAALLQKNGVNVIIDATGNRRNYRERARDMVENFMEVYVKCPVEVCMKRDPKGIYKKVKEGAISSLPGIQDSYEEPISPEIIIESDKISGDEGACLITKKLQDRGWIP
jgi:adenylylsulfate kinase